MLIKYTLRNDLKEKYIGIPMGMQFNTTGDDLRDIIYEERKKALKELPTDDFETIKYTYPNSLANNGNGLLIQFRFWDPQNTNYSTAYQSAGFTNQEILLNRNAFTKSFFRLYFYDSNSGETSNLIFSEDIGLYNTSSATLPFNRLYWLRNDKIFTTTNNNKIVYMDARFFNAKNGKTVRFINSNPLGQPPNTPISITDYSNPNNRDWRTSAISIINPRNNNGMYNFIPVVPFGTNQPGVITLSEFVMQ